MMSEQAFWAVSFGFYLFSCVKILRPEELLFVSSGKKWKPVTPWLPFQPSHRVLGLLLPLPWETACVLGWSRGSGRTSIGSARPLKAQIDSLFVYRVAGTAAFASLFIAGPITTHFLGLRWSLSVLGPLHVVLLVVCSLSLIRDHGRLKVPAARVVGVIWEWVFCPGYLANAYKRVGLTLMPAPRADSLLRLALSKDPYPRWLPAMTSYATELDEGDGVSIEIASRMRDVLNLRE